MTALFAGDVSLDTTVVVAHVPEPDEKVHSSALVEDVGGVVTNAAIAKSSMCSLSPWLAVATNSIMSSVATSVIAGRTDAAVSRRRRALHSGRIVASNDTSAEPMNTASAKPIRTNVQFMAAG